MEPGSCMALVAGVLYQLWEVIRWAVSETRIPPRTSTQFSSGLNIEYCPLRNPEILRIRID